MPKLNWKIIKKGENPFPETLLPPNATQLKEPNTMDEMMIRALPFVFPAILTIFLTVFFKTRLAGFFVLNPVLLPVGFFAGFLLLPLHETLHAVVYPKNASVTMGFLPKSAAFFVYSNHPLSKKRFIIMSLLPVFLGIVPFLLFLFSDPANKTANTLLFGLMAMGLTSPYPDYYNIFQVLKQVPAGAKIQTSGFHAYWYR